MARIATKTYRFDVPADAVKAHIYYEKGKDPTYDSPFIEVTFPAGTPQVSVPIPGSSNIGEGTYTLETSVFDAAGNESDLGAKVTFPFDFTAPSAPTNGAVL